jgi:hypothetical protein
MSLFGTAAAGFTSAEMIFASRRERWKKRGWGPRAEVRAGGEGFAGSGTVLAPAPTSPPSDE